MSAQPQDLPTATEFLKKQKRFESLVASVFGHGAGRELLEALTEIYVDGKLYQDNDRETVYCVAQRDLIMELKHLCRGVTE